MFILLDFLHIKAKRCGNILKLKESLVVLKSDQVMKLKLGDRIRHTTELGTPMIYPLWGRNSKMS